MKTSQFENAGIYLRYENMDAGTVRELKLRFLDAVIAMMGGVLAMRREELDAFLCTADGAPVARAAYPPDMKTSPESAALLNGVYVRYADWGDTYRGELGIAGHPSDQIAAVLALCDDPRCSGKRVLEALYTAYQLFALLQDKMLKAEPRLDHTSAMSITVPVIEAICRGRSLEQAQNALNLSACGGIVLGQARPADITNLKAAATAYAQARALWCCRLSRAISAPASMFDGRYGWYNAAAPFNGELRVDDPGHVFRASEIKTFPCFHAGQSAVESSLALHKEIAGRRVTGLRIRIGESDASHILRAGQSKYPASQPEADHHMAYCLVTALLRGALTPRQYMKQALEDPETRRLIDLISVELLTAQELSDMDAGKGACRLIVTTGDGSVFTHTTARAEGVLEGLDTAGRCHRLERILEKKKRMLEKVYGFDLSPLFRVADTLEDHGGAQLLSAVQNSLSFCQCQ